MKDDNLRNTIPFIKHVFYPKGTVIFREGENSNKFYCVIRGRISLRVKKLKKKEMEEDDDNNEGGLNLSRKKSSLGPRKKTSSNFFSKGRNLKKKPSSVEINSVIGNLGSSKDKRPAFFDNLKRTVSGNFKLILNLEDDEEERIQFTQGNCFGEWAIIYNQPRSGTAYVLEDTDLFYLDKDDFNDHFAKPVVKSDMDRKFFLKSRITTLSQLSKFDEYYKRIVPIFLERNKIIYKEGSKGTCVYLVFHGEFILEKDLIIHKDEERKNEKTKNLLRLERGAFAGLETIFETTGSYAFTLKSSVTEFNVLFKIDLDQMGEHKISMIEDLRHFFEKQNILIGNIFEKHKEIKMKTSVSYRTLIPKNESLDIKIINEKEKEKEKKLKSLVRQNIRPIKLGKNTLHFKSIKLSKKYIKVKDMMNEEDQIQEGLNFRNNLANKTESKMFKFSKDILLSPPQSPDRKSSVLKIDDKRSRNSHKGLSADHRDSDLTHVRLEDKVIHLSIKSPHKINLYELSPPKEGMNPLYLTQRSDKKSNIPNLKLKFPSSSSQELLLNLKKSAEINLASSKNITNKYISQCASVWKDFNSQTEKFFYDTSCWNLPLLSKIIENSDEKEKESPNKQD